MQLRELVETSQQIGATASRLEKIALLREFLRRLERAEIELGVLFLSGEIRQNKLGAGPAAVFAARRASPAAPPSLSLSEVDAALAQIAAAGPESRPGSGRSS